jgi:hypothetical protein
VGPRQMVGMTRSASNSAGPSGEWATRMRAGSKPVLVAPWIAYFGWSPTKTIQSAAAAERGLRRRSRDQDAAPGNPGPGKDGQSRTPGIFRAIEFVADQCRAARAGDGLQTTYPSGRSQQRPSPEPLFLLDVSPCYAESCVQRSPR